MTPPDVFAPHNAGLTQSAELSFPADPDLVMLARMVSAAAASRAGFGLEQVEDLRLAVNELCLSLIGPDRAEGVLLVRFAWGQDAVEVVVSHHRQGGTPSAQAAMSSSPERELSTRILETLVDEYGLDDASGTARAWLRVRRA
jgi:serine/threonine-protein kinase RsbW